MKILATVLGLSVSAFGCVVGDEGLGSSDDKVLGGVVDNGDPSVVALRYSIGGGSALCTATVIAPTVLLTAGHCSGGWSYQYNPHTATNWTDPSDPGWIDAALVAKASPDYDGNAADGHDVGIVQLSAPTSLTPIALGAAPTVGSTVRLVGYGRTAVGSDPQTTGTKHVVDVSVSSVAAHEFVGGRSLVGACHGDSGGPTLQAGNLVGVNSYVDQADCSNSTTHFMRVDDNRRFIDPYLGSGGGGGGGGSGDSSACIAACNGDPACINGCLGL